MEDIMNVHDFDRVWGRLETIFKKHNFVHTVEQYKRTILAACEDPFTITQYTYQGLNWPLPQTNQMNLERQILTNPNVNGFYTLSTSYRQEVNPVPGRHDLIFPMIEFEGKGNMNNLMELEKEIIENLGIMNASDVKEIDYLTFAKQCGVKELTNDHEELLCQMYGPAVLLKNFPEYTYPFWNMKRWEEELVEYSDQPPFDVQTLASVQCSKKVDVIIGGIETIGSAERSCNPTFMMRDFYTIIDGEYSKKLFSDFTKERVMKEMNDYLSLPFIPRYGAGIGASRLVRYCSKIANQ